MPDTNQLECAIAEANRRMAASGYQNVDQTDLLLAGFGYLATKMERQGVVIKLTGKLPFAIAAAVGGLVVGAIQKILKGGP